MYRNHEESNCYRSSRPQAMAYRSTRFNSEAQAIALVLPRSRQMLLSSLLSLSLLLSLIISSIIIVSLVLILLGL